MITKERLLSGLKELTYVEEGMVTMLANFSKAVIDASGNIPSEKKNEMVKILSRLYQDSARHKEKVTLLVDKIEKGSIDVY